MSRDDDTMKCENYQKALAAEPGFQDETGHAEQCADCQAFAADIDKLDAKLEAAMSVAVPPLAMPDLPAIEDDTVVSLASRRRSSSPVMRYALAATVALAAVLGVQLMFFGASNASLQEQVLAHVDHEPQALLPTRVPVDESRLVSVVPASLGTMNHDAGLITYAKTCPINGKPVPHLVIQGERGPITILLMPDEKIRENSVIDGESVHGILIQNGGGSIAIIGERDEPLDRVADNLMNTMSWDT